MNSLVVHYSKFGNTQKVAEAVAEILETSGSVKVISINQLSASDLNGTDLVVMGAPTHKMNLPEVVRESFQRLPRRILHGTSVAAFDTSYKMSRWLAPFTASRKVAGRLRKLGGKCVVSSVTFHVKEKAGPLYDDEIERAKKWAELILSQIKLKFAK
jgi:flavodoxin